MNSGIRVIMAVESIVQYDICFDPEEGSKCPGKEVSDKISLGFSARFLDVSDWEGGKEETHSWARVGGSEEWVGQYCIWVVGAASQARRQDLRMV